MATPVIVYGRSGSGKSDSIREFGTKEILLDNVEGKNLPFRKKFEYTIKTDNLDVLIDQLRKMPCKAAVIDDAGYMAIHYFMTYHRAKKGNSSFEMYDAIADITYQLVSRIKNEVEDDKIVYIMMHEDIDDYGNTKLRTIGRLIDNKVCLEGMVTICIRCMSSGGKHYFKVRTDGTDVTKTPRDMFETAEIPNDLKYVDTVIREYYGLETIKQEGKENAETE